MRTTETAAITNYLIERREGRREGKEWVQVNLCESQGEQWITIRRGISRETAGRFGFNLNNPGVARVLRGSLKGERGLK